MATEINTGSGLGTHIQPGAQGSVFESINLTAQLTANALVAPVDAPAVDELRVLRDASAKRTLFHYNTTDGWAGIEAI